MRSCKDQKSKSRPDHIHCVSKNCAKLFSSELHQISTNFANFWQKDAKLMRAALTFHLTYFVSPHYRVKRTCFKLLHNGYGVVHSIPVISKILLLIKYNAYHFVKSLVQLLLLLTVLSIYDTANATLTD